MHETETATYVDAQLSDLLTLRDGQVGSNAQCRTAQVRASSKFRAMMAKLKDIELLVQLGEYQQGQDSLADYALENREAINSYLRQGQNEPSLLSNTTAVLRSIGGEYGD